MIDIKKEILYLTRNELVEIFPHLEGYKDISINYNNMGDIYLKYILLKIKNDQYMVDTFTEHLSKDSINIVESYVINKREKKIDDILNGFT